MIPGGNSRETDNILLVWREKLHGNSLTTPPFIFSGVFIDEEMQSKKLQGAISLEEILWIFPLYLFDCSRGVATNYY